MPITQTTRVQNNSGIILVDILIALALGVLFTACMTYTSIGAEDLLETARERSYALDHYEANRSVLEGMMPYESRNLVIAPGQSGELSRFSTTTITAYAHWYGNDRIQTDITISSDPQMVNHREIHPIVFNKVRAYPYVGADDSVGVPLCSVDLSSPEYVGSYIFQHPDTIPSYPRRPDSLRATIVPLSLPIDPSLPLTDIEVRRGIAYISSDSTTASDPDLIIVDISNADDPMLISSINTGPGISALSLAGQRIFAAAASTAAQLHIVRLDSLDAPVLEHKYTLPLPHATATPPYASSIFYDTQNVYLGTGKWDGEEFSTIDVTDILEPHKTGGLEIGSKVMDIFVRFNTAYLGTAGEYQLIQADITDTDNPLIVDHFDPSGWERQEGKATSYFEDALNLGRTSGGFNIKNDHELFSWEDLRATTSMSIVESYFAIPHASVDLAGGVYGLIADRSFVYVASRTIDKEFQVFDHTLSTSSAASFPLPVAPQAMTCDSDRLYILAGTAPVVYQISFR